MRIEQALLRSLIVQAHDLGGSRADSIEKVDRCLIIGQRKLRDSPCRDMPFILPHRPFLLTLSTGSTTRTQRLPIATATIMDVMYRDLLAGIGRSVVYSNEHCEACGRCVTWRRFSKIRQATSSHRSIHLPVQIFRTNHLRLTVYSVINIQVITERFIQST